MTAVDLVSGLDDTLPPPPGSRSGMPGRDPRVPGPARGTRRLDRVRRLRRTRTRVASVLLLGALVAVPFMIEVRSDAPPEVPVQVVTPMQPIADSDLAVYRANALSETQRSPVVLSYRDIGPGTAGGGRADAISPEQLEREMRALHESGFTALSSVQFQRFLGGQPVPPRSVYITVAGNSLTTWTHVDPILARYELRAAAILTTGAVGRLTPSEVTWPVLRRLRATGRWDLESQTHLGDGRVPTDPLGAGGSFLVNRRWLTNDHRIETVDEWRTRIRHDIRATKRDLGRRGAPVPIAFAFPRAARDAPTNDPQLRDLLTGIMRAEFPIVIADARRTATAGAVTRAQVAAGMVEPIAVRSQTSDREFFERITSWDADQVGALRPIADLGSWTGEGAPIAGRFSADTLTLTPPDGGRARATFGFGRLSGFSDLGAAVDLSGLGGGEAGASASVELGAPGWLSYSATVSRDRLTVSSRQSGAPTRIFGGALRDAAEHSLTIQVTAGRVRVEVDGRTRFDAPIAPDAPTPFAGGLALEAGRERAESPEPTFANLRILTPVGE